MNNTEKMHEIYFRLHDLSSLLSVLQCLDVEMISFSDCKENGSHKTVLTGVSLIASDMRKRIDEILLLTGL